MRINESTRVDASAEEVWNFLADFTNYPGFMVGLTRWEPVGERTSGFGARFRLLIHVGAADVGGLIEVVEWHQPTDIAFTSVTGIDQRGRWRIREGRDNTTRVEFRWAYGVAGGGIGGIVAERLAAPTLRRNLRRSLSRLKLALEGEPARAGG
ncbi:MAG: SRPBCC family protein [Solirubrobacterales bacterium]